MTNLLAVVVSLYYLLALWNILYLMPLAYGVMECCCAVSICTVAWVVLLYCSSACPPEFSLKELCLSELLGFCSLFYLVHICNAPWDSLAGLMHSGRACLACDWLIYEWCLPKCVCCKLSCDWLLL